MHHARAAGAAAACLIVLIALAGPESTVRAQARLPNGPIPVDCDRACLEGLINQYLAALVAHDPKGLPLSADVKYTEQEQVLTVGDGFWKTVTGRGNYNHYFADPETAQAGWMGTMRERNGLLLMTVRLRVQLGRITEIETSYFRAGGGPNNIAAMDKQGTPDALWLQPIPPPQRASRQQLIAIANAYFEAVQKNDGKGFYPFTDDCDRIENGAHTTNTPSPKPNTPGGFNYMGLDCKGQLESGYLAIVNNIHQRRFPLVDEERGVVWANCVFDMDGTVSRITLNTGEVADMGGFAGRASSIHVTEAFRIENNLIRRVEMVGTSVPYHFNSAWPGGLSGK